MARPKRIVRQVFADTNYWIALLSPDDELNEVAVALSEELDRDGYEIVTSDYVLTEFLNTFASRGEYWRGQAAAIVADLLSDQSVTVIESSRDLFLRATELYSRMADKEWSVVDCSSILIMRERGITDALTHDHHFEQAGMRARLRE